MVCDLKRFFVAMLLLRICEYAAASTFPLALPNCKDHCGDANVLYPFGIGQGCYKDKWFEIVCSSNSSEQLSVPFLLSIGREVLSFDLGSYYAIEGRSHYQSNKIRILSPLKHTRRCLSLSSEHCPTMRDAFIELDRIQSKKKGIRSRTQNDEEHGHIRIAMPESMTLGYSSPDIVIEHSSFSLGSEPLMPHKTQ